MSEQFLGYTIIQPSAPTIAAATVSGLLTASGIYGYKLTSVTPFGESLPSSAATFTATSTRSTVVTLAAANNPNITSYKLYRTAANGSVYKFLTNLPVSATTVTDTAADVELVEVNPPAYDGASSILPIKGSLLLEGSGAFSIQSGITAGAGGIASTAYQLTKEYNHISTVATTNDAVKLLAVATRSIGTRTVIKNGGANTARIYPATGQTINNGSADAPITLAAGAAVQLVCDSATNWLAF